MAEVEKPNVVEHLPSMHKALGAIPSIAKKKKKKKSASQSVPRVTGGENQRVRVPGSPQEHCSLSQVYV
jgi:hypothetical protein